MSYLYHAYVGVSDELTEYLAARIGITRPRLKTIINGVDTVRFVPRQNQKRTYSEGNMVSPPMTWLLAQFAGSIQ